VSRIGKRSDTMNEPLHESLTKLRARAAKWLTAVWTNGELHQAALFPTLTADGTIHDTMDRYLFEDGVLLTLCRIPGPRYDQKIVLYATFAYTDDSLAAIVEAGRLEQWVWLHKGKVDPRDLRTMAEIRTCEAIDKLLPGVGRRLNLLDSVPWGQGLWAFIYEDVPDAAELAAREVQA